MGLFGGTASACHLDLEVRATVQARVHVEYMCVSGAFPTPWTVCGCFQVAIFRGLEMGLVRGTESACHFEPSVRAIGQAPCMVTTRVLLLFPCVSSHARDVGGKRDCRCISRE